MFKIFGKSGRKCNKNGKCCIDCNKRRQSKLLQFRITAQRKIDEQCEKLTNRISHLQSANKKLQTKLNESRKSCPVQSFKMVHSVLSNWIVLQNFDF